MWDVGMAAFVLEREAFGRALQSFPGWWQMVSKPLVCAGEICVSCRTGCACACKRGVPFVGRHRGQLMGEEGQEGSFLFSLCVACTGGRSYCAKSVGDAQPRNGWRAGNGGVLTCIEVSGSWLHCVLSDKILITIKRFGESVLKKTVLLVQNILLCAVMERSDEDQSAVQEDLLLFELSF